MPVPSSLQRRPLMSLRPHSTVAPHRRGAVNKGCLIALAAVLVPLVILAMVFWGGYNGLVGTQEDAEQKWAQVENQYQRRFDLVPNLVNTVQGAADFEQETLQAVTDARASVGQVQLPDNLPTDQASLDAYVGAQRNLGSALGRLFAVSENYPQLRAVAGFQDLQSQLEGTENRIAVARKDYTEAVATFNKKVRRFPSNVIAGLFGFEKLPQFSVSEAVSQNPTVDFGSDE